MPSLDTNHWKSLACVTTNTPDRRPVIGLVEDGKICLQLGGNGYSAKSGDALGELGASLLLEQEWTSPIPAAALAPDRFRSNEPI
jgi:glycine/D-amino acid oxidase-like deaminating enzyme